MSLPPVVLVSGPLFGSLLWRDVSLRLRAHGLDTVEVSVEPGDGDLSAHVERLAAGWASGPAPIVVAHHLAVPLVLRAAALRPPAGLVLANGPIDRLDPVLGGLAVAHRHLGPLGRAWLRPAPLVRLLASHLGLRRAVVNPYVMDRDTVVALLGAAPDSSAWRRGMAAWIAELPRAVEHPPQVSVPTLLVWGDADPLYPVDALDQAMLHLPRARLALVRGGRLMHPVERPWEIADAIHAWWGAQG